MSTIISAVLGPDLAGNIVEFYKKAMPANQTTLTVIIARKAYALYRAIQEFYDDAELHTYDDMVIHSQILSEWLATNPDKASALTQINVVDDTLLHGSSLRGCLDHLRAYGYGSDIVTTYVFSVNQQLTEMSHVSKINRHSRCERPLLYLEETPNDGAFLFTGLLKDGCEFTNASQYKFIPRPTYRLRYFKTSSRQASRRLARLFIETIHACSIPYITNRLVYQLHFDEAVGLLFKDLPTFPDKKCFHTAEFHPCLSPKLSPDVDLNSTIESGEKHGVYTRCVKLHDNLVYGFEQTPILRVYANYNLKQVLLIPYSVFKPYTTELDVATIPYLKPLLRTFASNEIHNETEEHHETLLRVLHYGRALEITQELFGEEFAASRDLIVPQPVLTDIAPSLLELWNNMKGRLPDLFQFSDGAIDDKFAEQVAAEQLVGYSVPMIFQREVFLHKQAYDLYFDSLSNIYRRTKGVSLAFFTKCIAERLAKLPSPSKALPLREIVHVLVAVLCDRGVSIPTTKAKLLDTITGQVAVGMRMCDGEMTSEAYAKVPDLACMPYVAYSINQMCTPKEWNPCLETEPFGGIKLSLFNTMMDSFRDNDTATYFIDYYFNHVTDYELGDYIIQPDGCYIYGEGISSPEQIRFFQIEREFTEKIFHSKDTC